ncbi:MAG: ABC transporter substrate-binding protein [Thermodesulfobacteriota bacterium]
MGRVTLALLVMAILISPVYWEQARGAEKLKYSVSFREGVSQALPVATALEQGFWKQEGLDIEYVPFKSGSQMLRAMASGHIKIGTDNAPGVIRGASRGVPIIMVSIIQTGSDWAIWVLPGGPIRKPEDLKGKKIGMSRRGGTSDAYARMTVKNLGIEKDVRIIAVGGSRARVAALTTGVIDAFPQAMSSAAPMVIKGMVRRLIDIGKQLPQPWIDQAVVALKEFVKTNPELARKAIRGISKAGAYIGANHDYAVRKVMSLKGYDRATAELALKGIAYSGNPVIDRAGVVNVRGFLLEYGLIKAAEAPPVDELYTNELVK